MEWESTGKCSKVNMVQVEIVANMKLDIPAIIVDYLVKFRALDINYSFFILRSFIHCSYMFQSVCSFWIFLFVIIIFL